MGAIAAVVGLVVVAVNVIRPDELPVANDAPTYRSSTFRETVRGVGTDDYVSEISADTTDRMVQVIFDRDDLVSWTGSETHWSSSDVPGELFENTEDDVQLHRDLLSIADGLTIDDVIPDGARRFTNVIETDSTTMLGRDVTMYDTQVDVNRLRAVNPIAMGQFEDFWGQIEIEAGAPAEAPLNVRVWTDADGVVYQVESRSDYSGSFYQLTFLEVSESEPFTPAFPVES